MISKNPIVRALEHIAKRGHLTLHQGRSFECARCGLSGSLGTENKRIGQLFKVDCGKPVGRSFV